MAAKPYTVLSPLRHDGQDYAVGEAVNLPPKAAGPLLAAGAIAEPNQRSGETGDSPEEKGAATPKADAAPESSTDAADPNATTSRGESPPTTEGAAGAPAAPRASAQVMPIGSKRGKKVGK